MIVGYPGYGRGATEPWATMFNRFAVRLLKTDHERTGTRATDRGDGPGGFDALSRAIGRFVYELYGLTEEEIELVEEVTG